MSNQPATPLDNKAAIAQMGLELRSSIGLLINEFVRPNAVAIAETRQALEVTRAICDSNARSIEAESILVRELRESVEVLNDVADDTALDVDRDDERISENEQRFQNLLSEAREDRRRSDERFEEQRRLSDQRFNAVMNEIRALGEQNRALLSALATTNGRVDSLEQAS
ncbi:MAG: hypothetical protein WA949_11625 [Phormidesmis sp.]